LPGVLSPSRGPFGSGRNRYRQVAYSHQIYAIYTTSAVPTLIVTAQSSTIVCRTEAVLDDKTLLIGGPLNNNNVLSKLDLTTGTVIVVGTLAISPGSFAAMDFLADGNLYGLDNVGLVWRIEPNSAGVTYLGNTGRNFWFDMTTSTLPTPSAIFLLGSGLVGLIAFRRKFFG
jgi:hypothetical protein